MSLVAGFAEVTVGLPGPDVSARVRLSAVHDRPFAIEAEQIHIGVVPVPEFLANWVIRNFDPAPGIAARMPFPVEIGSVTLTPEGIEIGTPGR